MIKKIVLLSFWALNISAAVAQERVPYLEEVRALGAVSGQGLVCNASKYDDFEMLARAIMLTKAPSDSALQKGVYAYNDAKANAYISTQADGGYMCDEIRRRFDNQDIFQATLYEDGTIQMPSGMLLTPRRPYDASQIYKKNTEDKKQLKAIYDGRSQKKKVVTFTVDGQKSDAASSGRQTATGKKVKSLSSKNNRSGNTVGHLRRSR